MKKAVNPFVVNTQMARIDVVQCFSKVKMVALDSIKVEDGIVLPKDDSMEIGSFGNSFLADAGRKCSLFQSEVTLSVIRNLDGNGRAMFLYIQYYLAKDSDTITLNREDYMEFSGYTSSRTFYNAVQQLTGASVIIRKKSNTYWVNPFVIFNGNRIEKYPANVRIKSKVAI